MYTDVKIRYRIGIYQYRRAKIVENEVPIRQNTDGCSNIIQLLCTVLHDKLYYIIYSSILIWLFASRRDE